MKKILWITLLFILFFQMNYGDTASTNQWKVVIYPFMNKSEKGREENLNLVIQNSIKTFLSKVNYLDISLENKEKNKMKDIFNEAYTNGYDIVVNGSYAVIGEKIYIYVNVYDVLQRLLKFEKSYSGSAGQDIFDTIDVIIDNLKQDVTKTVKPMDEETLVKYRKRVELVSDEIKLNRSFVTTLGMNSSFYDHYTWLPFIELDLRLGDIFFGFESFMPLLVANQNTQDNWKNNLMSIYAGYRFNSLIAGAGIMPTFSMLAINNNSSSGSSPGSNSGIETNTSPASLGFMIFVKYDVSAELSLKASVAVAALNLNNSGNNNNNGGNNNSASPQSIMVPVFNLGADYFPAENWGLKLDLYYAAISSQNYHGGNVILLTGINYKVDFY